MPSQTAELANTNLAKACLATLIILQLVMLGALFAQSAPHPPATIPLFAIAPFLAVALSAAVAAMMVGPLGTRMGRALCIAAALMALLSYGPQKYFDPQFALIWPAVITGQIASVALIWMAVRTSVVRAA
jgi:hypothetical protein